MQLHLPVRRCVGANRYFYTGLLAVSVGLDYVHRQHYNNRSTKCCSCLPQTRREKAYQIKPRPTTSIRTRKNTTSVDDGLDLEFTMGETGPQTEALGATEEEVLVDVEYPCASDLGGFVWSRFSLCVCTIAGDDCY